MTAAEAAPKTARVTAARVRARSNVVIYVSWASDRDGGGSGGGDDDSGDTTVTRFTAAVVVVARRTVAITPAATTTRNGRARARHDITSCERRAAHMTSPRAIVAANAPPPPARTDCT